MNTIQDVVMTLVSDVRFKDVAVNDFIDVINNVINNNDVQLIVGNNDIAYKNDGWCVTDEYHFIINGKHIVIGQPFYVGAIDDINMFNKHLVICGDNNRVVCANHIVGMPIIYRE